MTTRLGSVQTTGIFRTWPEDAIYIGMPCNVGRIFGIPDSICIFGKPWHLREDPRGWAAAYVEYLVNKIMLIPSFAEEVKGLNGKLLLCWCTAKAEKRHQDVACHGRILMEFVEMLNT